jgi:hypothetical protein
MNASEVQAHSFFTPISDNNCKFRLKNSLEMKKLFEVLGLVFILLILFTGISFYMSAIPGQSKREDTKLISGKLRAISTCCPGGDIIFRLENPSDNSAYYINRGVENGLDANLLKDQLLEKEITIAYHKRGWNVMNFTNEAKHICEVRYGEQVLYTEITN